MAFDHVQDQLPPTDEPAIGLWVFIVGSAVVYAAAMIVMKYWGQLPPMLILSLVALLMGIGVAFEINALQVERIGMVYVLILGIEVIVVATASAVLFNETFTWREIVGGAMIVVGTAVAWS
ncbi:MAG: EamA family transporter [Pseudomonadota bacterium]